ncbi:MAG: RHS repeat-associated core domain-containing protein, partial [candidate division KSB1 bacterium]|nr:RHS repeat-associated core domain-containing protein [candidate division KSB1 bacterium]
GQRVAMRENGTLYYLLTDHLGSTAITANGSGNRVAELRYKVWGETRYTWGTTPTTVRFTGQREESTIGLYFYNARWYDPALGRFTQPDTLVPNPGDPQQLNRYSYALNNPVRYRDPSGHWIETAWDVANIAWDLYEVQQDPSLLNVGALVVDVGAAVLPFVPAGAGLVARGGKAAKVAAGVATHADDAARLARIAARAERFAGASPEVMRGVERLAKLVESERIPARFRHGLEAQLRRAEEYYKAGNLKAVEFVEGANRYDLVLDTGTVVEVKYWRESYATGHVEGIIDQLKRYQASGRQLKLEFVRTSTDPITDEFLKQLREQLQKAGIDLSRLTIEVVD